MHIYISTYINAHMHIHIRIHIPTIHIHTCMHACINHIISHYFTSPHLTLTHRTSPHVTSQSGYVVCTYIYVHIYHHNICMCIYIYTYLYHIWILYTYIYIFFIYIHVFYVCIVYIYIYTCASIIHTQQCSSKNPSEVTIPALLDMRLKGIATNQTSKMTLDFVSYNGNIDMFFYVCINFDFTTSGWDIVYMLEFVFWGIVRKQRYL